MPGAAALQVFLVMAVMLGAVMAPPASGSLMLVPLDPGNRPALLKQALENGALLEGAGPLPGSYVVRARRDALFLPMLGRGVLVLAARPVLCGKAGSRAA